MTSYQKLENNKDATTNSKAMDNNGKSRFSVATRAVAAKENAE